MRSGTRPSAVGEGVVGDHAVDRVDAVGGEVGGGAGQEGCGGDAFLVRVDLGVGQSGVVIDGGVDVVVADRAAVDPPAAHGLRTAVDVPSAAVRDPAELLDIKVDRVAGPGVLVTAGAAPAGSGDLAGYRVTGRQ